MGEHIIALLRLFQAFMPDQETAAWVLDLASDENKWNGAHDLFDKVRRRNLAAISSRDVSRQRQYYFEEICLKALYNESGSPAPFDSDSTYWIVPFAIQAARHFGVPVDSVNDIVAPPSIRFPDFSD